MIISNTFLQIIKEYKTEKKKDPPDGDKMLEIYKKGFGGQSQLNRLNKNDKEDLYWFLTSVASGVSAKASNSKKKQTYRESVTITDEAYAFMVLQHHRQKWKPESEEDKKKRVTGGDKEKSLHYYTEMTGFLKKFREEHDDKFLVGEEWLETERKKEEKDQGG